MTRRNRLLAAGGVVVALALILLATQLGGDDNGSGSDPEDVAVAYLRALDAKDYGAMWDNASSSERDNRDRVDYVAYWESLCGNPCTPGPTVPADTTYEVTYNREDGQWRRIGIRRRRPDRPQPELDEVIVTQEDGRWGAVESGPEGFDPDESS